MPLAQKRPERRSRRLQSARVPRWPLLPLVAIWTFHWCLAGNLFAAEPEAAPQFERDVQPLLKTYCWKCHGGEGLAAGLDLRSLPLMIRGGARGAAIKPGDVENSLLYRRLAANEMPPGDALKPTPAHLETIKSWIAGGAPARYTGGPPTEDENPPLSDKDRNWWAFRRPVQPEIPPVKTTERVQTPIDAFVLARLEAGNLSFAPPADRLTLLRRAYLDLVGLPPPPEEIEPFCNDTAPDAWERLVDRLLDSPHYGERWGRHWLDAAGYVDVIGTDNDASIIELRDGNWQYRDYVVRALNADLPYDRFLLEQLAGDELADWRNAREFSPETKDLLIATGFLRQAADVTYAPELNTADIRHQVVYDTLQMFSTNVLGLTLHCAQCHSHKFDPLSQVDYYRLLGIFGPAYNVQNWMHSRERHLADVPPAEKLNIDRQNAEIDRQLSAARKQVAETRQLVRHVLLHARAASLPEPIRADVVAAVEAPAEKRNEVQKYLFEKFGTQLHVTPDEVTAAFDEPTRQAIASAEQRIASLPATRRSYGTIQATWEAAPPPTTYLYRRGGFETPGAVVLPGFPAVLNASLTDSALSAERGAGTSGYRTALARWLTQPDHPLTARVIVNRVWQQYFGRGIVSTPDNFGRSGAIPTHPELLDWLATEFVRSGWKFKSLHKLIMTSSVYQQSSALTGPPADADPENLLLWRMPLRRLESEIVRDSILAVSGQLDERAGGPPVPVKPLPDGMVVVENQNLPAGTSPFRRSLYLVSRRNYQPTELNVFDQPLVATNCTRRTSAAVALQSLTLLNGQFASEQAERFSERLAARAGANVRQRIEQAFRIALSRPPTLEETEASRALLEKQMQRALAQPGTTPEQASAEALAHLCQMLLNTNEFLYVP